MGTGELVSARRKEQLNEAQLAELLDVSVEINGLLKTVTEKDLLQKYEEEFKAKEELKKQDRRVLEWSGKGEESARSQKKSDASSSKKKGVFNNGAISIVDNRNPKLVGELNSNLQDSYLDSSGSMQSLEEIKLEAGDKGTSQEFCFDLSPTGQNFEGRRH